MKAKRQNRAMSVSATMLDGSGGQVTGKHQVQSDAIVGLYGTRGRVSGNLFKRGRQNREFSGELEFSAPSARVQGLPSGGHE
jgi:hypothetical protein